MNISLTPNQKLAHNFICLLCFPDISPQFFSILKGWNIFYHLFDHLLQYNSQYPLYIYKVYCWKFNFKHIEIVFLFEAIQLYSDLRRKTPVPLARSTASGKRLFSRTSPRTTQHPFPDVLPGSKRRLTRNGCQSVRRNTTLISYINILNYKYIK